MAEEEVLAWRIQVLGTDEQVSELSALDTEIKGLNKTTNRLEKSAAKLRREGKQDGNAFKSLTATITENRKRSLELSVAKQKLTKDLRLEAQRVQSTAGSYDRLKIEQQQLVNSTKALDTTTKKGSQTFERNRKQIERNRKKLKEFDQKLAGTAQRSKKSFGLIGGVARAVGPSLLAAFGIGALIRFGKGIIDTQKNFEKAMSGVKAISQATDQELESLTNTAKTMGETTVFSATQAAEAMKLLAQAGFDVQEITTALPGVLNLAASAGIDLGEAADIAANALRAYGFDASEIGRINDVMVGTFTSANLNITDFNEAFKLIAPISKGVGISIEEISASIGLLADAGLKGSIGGTALRSALASLLNPTGAAVSIIKKLGLEVNDSQGNLKGMADIIEELETKGASTADLLALFGKRAGPGMKVLVDRGSAALREFTKELEENGGIAERVAEEQLDNLAGDLTILDSAYEGLSITLGEKTNPALRSITKELTLILGRTNDIIKSEQLSFWEKLGAVLGNVEGRVTAEAEASKKRFEAMSDQEKLTQKITIIEAQLSAELGNSVVALEGNRAKLETLTEGSAEYVRVQGAIERQTFKIRRVTSEYTGQISILQGRLDRLNKAQELDAESKANESSELEELIRLTTEGVITINVLRKRVSDLTKEHNDAELSSSEFNTSLVNLQAAQKALAEATKGLKNEEAQLKDEVKKTTDALKEQEEFFARQAAIVEANRAKVLITLQASFLEGEITESQFRARRIELDQLMEKVLLDNQRDLLMAKLALVKKGSADEAAIILELEEMKIDLSDKEIEREQAKNDALQQLRLIRAKSLIEQQDIEFEQLILKQEEELILFQGTLEQRALLEEMHREQQEELERGHLQARLQEWGGFLQGVQQGITIFSQFTQADQNKRLAAQQEAQSTELKNFDRNQAEQLNSFTGTQQAKEDLVEKLEGEREKFIAGQVAKEEALRKEFAQKQKQIARVQALINAALAITQVFATTPPPASFLLAAITAVSTAAQIAVIDSEKIVRGTLFATDTSKGLQTQTAAVGTVLEGPSHANHGIRTADGQYEFEGGEAVINKKSTALFRQELSDINSYKGYGRKLGRHGLTIGSARAPIPYQRGGLGPTGGSIELDTEELADNIGSILSDRINDLQVFNNVTDTTEQQTTISNIESEVNF